MPDIIDVRGESARIAQALAAIGGGVSGIINPNQEIQRQVRTLISTDPNAAAALGYAVRQNPDAFKFLGDIRDELALMPETPEMVVRGAATSGLAALTSPDIDPARAIQSLTPIQMNAVAGLFGLSPQQLVAQPGQVKALAEASPELYDIGAVRELTGARPPQLRAEEIAAERGELALQRDQFFMNEVLPFAQRYIEGLPEEARVKGAARSAPELAGYFVDEDWQREYNARLELARRSNEYGINRYRVASAEILARQYANETNIPDLNLWIDYILATPEVKERRVDFAPLREALERVTAVGRTRLVTNVYAGLRGLEGRMSIERQKLEDGDIDRREFDSFMVRQLPMLEAALNELRTAGASLPEGLHPVYEPRIEYEAPLVGGVTPGVSAALIVGGATIHALRGAPKPELQYVDAQGNRYTGEDLGVIAAAGELPSQAETELITVPEGVELSPEEVEAVNMINVFLSQDYTREDVLIQLRQDQPRLYGSLVNKGIIR